MPVTQMIGYVTTFWADQRRTPCYIYYFWPKLIKKPGEEEWRRGEGWIGSEVFKLDLYPQTTPEETGLSHRKVICLAYEGDVPAPAQDRSSAPWLSKNNFTYVPASRVGFLPVLTVNDLGEVTEDVCVISYMQDREGDQGELERVYLDHEFLRKTDDTYSAALPAEALTGEEGSFTVPADGGTVYHLKEGRCDWQVFNNYGGYIFPRYIFWEDLEKTLPDRLYDQIVRYRPNYRDCRNDIMSIAIDLTQNLLTVFSGDPGCGKTSICNIFAQVLGLRGSERYVTVPVERGWTSKRDFIGYYNPLQGGLVLANKALYEGLKDADEEDTPLLVLLDEANLSSMEYYWSDFMQIAGSDENEADRTINLGGEETVPVSEKCRFAATINNDHTTEELSPRIIDRAAIVSLPTKPYEEGEPLPRKAPENRAEPVSWSDLQAAFGGSTAEMTGEALAVYGELQRMLEELRVVVSNRAKKAIRRFWNAARQEGVFAGETQEERDIAALDYAAAQRLLPKLAGSGVEFRKKLEALQQYCEEKGLTKCKEILDGIIQRGGEADSALSYYSFF